MPDMGQAIHDYVRLEEPFEGEVPVTYLDGEVWYSLRILCDIIGVKAQDQIARIQADTDVLSRFLDQVEIKTRTGKRLTWAIKQQGIGWWLATIRRGALAPKYRAHIIQFQEHLIEEANRLFWSEREHNPLADLRAQLITMERRYADLSRYTIALESRVSRLEEQD